MLEPYEGPSSPAVDRTSLDKKILCGYQGWFACQGDEAERGWIHYGERGKLASGFCNIDAWPDVSELTEPEKFRTTFEHADGSPAYLFSSYNQATVQRHFRWMREHGLDGVFLQRFGVEVVGAKNFRQNNQVLRSCRLGANDHGRVWAVMYDLSGLPAGGIQTVIDDWKLLVDLAKIGRDPADKAYLQHRGKPVVAVWGIGFNDGRKYTLAECERLIDFLKDDPQYGGNCVMLGLPTFWRELKRDCVNDAAVHRIAAKADVVSPWTVGRYRTPAEAQRYASETMAGDIAWCRERKVDYLPVAFPGFSRHNGAEKKPFDEIPRRKGEFLWSQYAAFQANGATMIYQAMFDEMDEGTAIFKCTNNPPIGASRFLDMEGLPSDHYLWLVGQGSKMLRGETPRTATMPQRAAAP